MHPSFSISGPTLDTVDIGETTLYVDMAADHCCLAIFHEPNQAFLGLEYYDTEKKNFEDSQQEIFNTSKLARAGSSKVVVAYNMPEALLIPDPLFPMTQPANALELVYGDLHEGRIFQEDVQGWHLKNVYRVPTIVHELIETRYTSGEYWHFYSLLLKRMQKISDVGGQDNLQVVFYPHRLVVALVKSGQLQLVQSFDYEIAEDVAYYLLNVSQQFHCDPNTIQLRISGLIDTDSPLYTELLKYFLHVTLDDRSANYSYEQGFNDYPLHFFTPVFSLAACE